MEVSKAVVLCAGAGTRLRPLTYSCPKPLLPVCNEPLLGHVVRALREADLRRIALVVSPDSSALRHYAGDGWRWGVELHYVAQPEALGLAHALAHARDFAGDDPFIMYLSDNLFEHGLTDFVATFRTAAPDAQIMLKPVDDARQFGVAVLAEGRVVDLIEKPASPPSNLAITGLYAFQPSIFESVAQIGPSGRGEYEITDAIKHCLDHGGTVLPYVTDGFWEDTGSPEALLRANRKLLGRAGLAVEGSVQSCTIQDRVGIGEGTMVTGCELVGPSIIGERCRVADSVIGPHVAIGDDCTVVGSRLQNCIVLPGCRLEGIRGGLADSVLAEQVQVESRPNASYGLRLLVGARSYVRVEQEP